MNEDEEEEDADEIEDTAGNLTVEAGMKKKSKKKKKKNSKKKAAPVPSKLPESRLLTGFTDYYIALGQTDPPSRCLDFAQVLYPPEIIIVS